MWYVQIRSFYQIKVIILQSISKKTSLLKFIKDFHVNFSYIFLVENKMFSSEFLKRFIRKPVQDLLSIILFVLRLLERSHWRFIAHFIKITMVSTIS